MLPLMRGPVPFPGRQRVLPAAVAMALFLTPGPARPVFGIDPGPVPPPGADTAPEPSHPKPHPSTADVKSELTNVIDAQLAAFRADDYAKAYTFAATGIKDLFTQADFEGMVRKSYPVIAHSTSVDYGMAFDTGEDAVIYVRVQNSGTKADGQFQYLLKKENGVWKIGGVAEVKPEGLSV